MFGLLSDFLSGDLEELRQTIEWCKGVGQIRRAPEIEKRWEELYRALNQAPPGRLGAFYVRRSRSCGSHRSMRWPTGRP